MKKLSTSYTGLTLIELILTVFILSTALIGFLKVFSIVSASTTSASYHSKALILSQESLDFLQSEWEGKGDLDGYCSKEVFGGMDPRLRGDDREDEGNAEDGNGRAEGMEEGEVREGHEESFSQELICEAQDQGILLTLITSWEIKGSEYHVPMRAFLMSNE
jgi:hypothetical protein